MTTDPAKRTDRTARKATAEQVMELSRNLPLTRSVPGRAVENATPGQLGFLAALFTAENASRAEPRTEPAARTGRIPPSQNPRRLRPGAWPRFPPTGDANSSSPSSSSTAPRTSCSTDDAGMRAGPRLAIAIGTLACQQGIPVRFLRRLRPDHAAAQGQNREQARPGTQDHRQGRPARHRRARIPAHRHRRRQTPVPGSSPTATVRRSIILRLESRVRPVGRRVRRRRHGRRGHRPHRPPRPHHPIPRRILPKHPLTHEINNNQGNQPTAHTVQHERRQCPE